MKILRNGFLTGLLLASFITPATADELPSRDEYAYGFKLTTLGDSGFYTAAIPIEVYRSVSDPGLRDAGVYNATGQPVPRIFEHTRENDTGTEQSIALGLIPLFGQQAEQAEQLELLIHQGTNGTRFELKTPRPETGPADAEVETDTGGDKLLTAYIVDVRELDHQLETLMFDWQTQPQGFIGQVSVETSNDLQHWRQLGSATLAELAYEDIRIEHTTLNLRAKLSDYLRITWQDMPANWALENVTGIYTEKDATQARESVILEAVDSGESAQEFIFDAAGYPPVDRANLLLPDDNIVIRANVYHRLNEQDSWRISHNGIFYNITRGGTSLQAPAVVVPTVRASQWKIRIESGTTTGPLRLELGWRPDHLVFLAQGSPPFELVTGRALDRLEQYPQERILGDSSIFAMLRQSRQADHAAIGPRTSIAGADKLEVAVTSRWRVLLLWAGLFGAIVLVGWLVFSLMKEMKQS